MKEFLKVIPKNVAGNSKELFIYNYSFSQRRQSFESKMPQSVSSGEADQPMSDAAWALVHGPDFDC